MVRAILSGTKTQTRRVVRSPARSMQAAGETVIAYRPPGDSWYKDHVWSMRDRGGTWGDYTHERFLRFCPYGTPGDRLWVRETFYCDHVFAGRNECVGHVDCKHTYADRVKEWRAELYYRADVPSGRFCDAGYWAEEGGRWSPSIHMPRWASRITLEVMDVRVERLQDISKFDACCEGPPTIDPLDPVGDFAKLWNDINGASAWDANPWVWVVSFTRIDEQRRAA
jgi:hypothetical protein